MSPEHSQRAGVAGWFSETVIRWRTHRLVRAGVDAGSTGPISRPAGSGIGVLCVGSTAGRPPSKPELRTQ
jgi:hypothetical protein